MLCTTDAEVSNTQRLILDSSQYMGKQTYLLKGTVSGDESCMMTVNKL